MTINISVPLAALCEHYFLVLQTSSTKNNLLNILNKFLQDSNRPYSINEIHEKCAKTDGKSAVQKALDKLVLKETVIEKQFGKQKIYFPKQEEEDNAEFNEINLLEKKLTTLQESLKEKEDKIKKLETEIKQLTSIPSLVDLQVRQDDLKIKVVSLTEKLKSVVSSQGTVTNAMDLNMKKVDEKYSKVVSAFRKRKRMCNDMIENIMEGYPKTKKHLIEETGIETDEMANFKINF